MASDFDINEFNNFGVFLKTAICIYVTNKYIFVTEIVTVAMDKERFGLKIHVPMAALRFKILKMAITLHSVAS